MLAALGEDGKSVAGFGYCFDEKHAILEVDGFPREGDRLPGECSPVVPCSRARAMASDELSVWSPSAHSRSWSRTSTGDLVCR